MIEPVWLLCIVNTDWPEEEEAPRKLLPRRRNSAITELRTLRPPGRLNDSTVTSNIEYRLEECSGAYPDCATSTGSAGGGAGRADGGRVSVRIRVWQGDDRGCAGTGNGGGYGGIAQAGPVEVTAVR
ncbi:hypothetical protein TNIN_232061 [Trichonephila inaurata madagascariensis]|uniref:Uncharacterized protein n=1 Tax=Trichonephila inaurata madagascariensis TaxID=2747483 RepID=A0A8X6X6G6_9ARAC|nr:hypothetical protein TNIN_232061 [Trichonephila inaurata madagascariensis]